MNNTEINLIDAPLLKIENLSVSFGAKNAPQVLQDFNLDIFEKDKIAIIGETGSGNSLNPLLKVGYQVGEHLIIHYGYSKKMRRQKP